MIKDFGFYSEILYGQTRFRILSVHCLPQDWVTVESQLSGREMIIETQIEQLGHPGLKEEIVHSQLRIEYLNQIHNLQNVFL